MKRILLSIILTTLFLTLTPTETYACNPPYDNSNCPPEQNPDFNFFGVYDGLINPITAPPSEYALQNYSHPLDDSAPQLTGLVSGQTTLQPISIYQVQGVSPPPFADLPSNYAPAVGFSVSQGSTIQVPQSGYDPSGNNSFEVQVLYADSNSITINYSTAGTPAVGYTIHIGNINVNQNILSLYNQSVASGRAQLVGLAAFQSLGVALSDEIIIAIRDTGSLMDPRWAQDWWRFIFDLTDPENPILTDIDNFNTNPNNCSTQNEGPFRPFAYSMCKLEQVPSSTITNATTFTASTKQDFSSEEVINSEVCDEKFWPQYSWEANISEDYTKARLPWAGFGKSPTVDMAESKYLADYYEGTTYYDGKRPTNQETWNKAGVFRKLAPSWYQDDLKCEMTKNPDENYEVKLEILGGDLNILGDLTAPLINRFANLIKVNQDEVKKITCPPKDPRDRTLWKLANPRDALLWAAVPMFTRADSPGKLTLTAQTPSTLTDQSGDGENSTPNKISYPLSVPHLKRLNAISSKTYSMLLPASISKKTLAQKPNLNTAKSTQNTTIASTSPLSPSNNILAQTTPVSGGSCAPGLNLYQTNNSDGSVNYSFKETLINNCYFRDTRVNVEYFLNGNSIGGCTQFFNIITHNDPNDPNNHPLQFACQPNYNTSQGGQLTARVSWFGGVMGGDQSYCGNSNAQGSSCQCTTTQTNTGQNTTCSTIPATPPPPNCGKDGPLIGPKENVLAQTDPKDPDKLDKIRKKDAKQKLNNQDDFPNSGTPLNLANTNYNLCIQGNTSKCKETKTYSTEISSIVELPYLQKIWQNIAQLKNSGLMNLFTLGTTPFNSKDNKTSINYQTTTSHVELTPTDGSLYIPYLQGTAEAQGCVSRRLLLPGSFPGTKSNANCPNFFNTF